MELDEGFTAGSGSSSGASNPDGGPLAVTANMNRALKYSSAYCSPLRNTLGFSSDWDQVRKYKVKDAVDSNGDSLDDSEDETLCGEMISAGMFANTAQPVNGAEPIQFGRKKR